jgi:hypothetical protein
LKSLDEYGIEDNSTIVMKDSVIKDTSVIVYIELKDKTTILLEALQVDTVRKLKMLIQDE